MTNNFCILVCDHFRKELETVIESEKFDDVAVATFPARFGRPPITWDELTQDMRGFGDCRQVHIIGGCCTATLEDSHRHLSNCRLHRMDQCFYLLANRDIIDNYLKERVFLLTPGWLARWREWIEQSGFDKETARNFFSESSTRLLLLDTGVDRKSYDRLQKFADFVDQPFESVPVGLDFLRLFLSRLVLEGRLENERNELSYASDMVQKQTADYAMALDLFGQLVRTTTEIEAIEQILNLFSMLFSPRSIFYLSLTDEKPGKVWSNSLFPVPLDESSHKDRLAGLDTEFAWTGSGRGFLLRIGYGGKILGVLEVDELSFPEHKHHYLNLALDIANVCGLSIDNSRKYQEVQRELVARRRSEEALQESEKRYRSLFDNMQSGFALHEIVLDEKNTPVDYIFLDVNEAFERQTGLRKDEILGKKVTAVIPGIEDDPANWIGIYGEAALNGKNISFENFSEAFQKWYSVVAYRPNKGQFAAVFTDITEGKQAEKALRESEARLQAILDHSPALISIKDLNGTVTMVNKRFEVLEGPPPVEFVGKSVFDLFPKDVADALWKNDLAALNAGGPMEAEEIVAHKDGTLHTYLTVKFPLYREADQPFGVCAISTDITDRKKMESRLQKQNEELEKSNQDLDAFGYIASHDLLEPLRGITNYSIFLMEDYADKLDEEGRSKLETLVRLCRREENLIESLLQYSRVGRTELAVEAVDLNTVVQNVIDSVKPSFSNSSLNISIPEPLPTIRCDSVRINEVFFNLITNAIKYNDKPEKFIKIGFKNGSQPEAGTFNEPVPEDGGERYIFYIRDNGIGIRDKHHDKIFTIFKRLHGRDKYGGGCGAGLTIVKKIVERHGGKIWVESVYGEGTTFNFTLQGHKR